jgi:hypothetical protein
MPPNSVPLSPTTVGVPVGGVSVTVTGRPGARTPPSGTLADIDASYPGIAGNCSVIDVWP